MDIWVWIKHLALHTINYNLFCWTIIKLTHDNDFCSKKKKEQNNKKGLQFVILLHYFNTFSCFSNIIIRGQPSELTFNLCPTHYLSSYNKKTYSEILMNRIMYVNNHLINQCICNKIDDCMASTCSPDTVSCSWAKMDAYIHRRVSLIGHLHVQINIIFIIMTVTIIIIIIFLFIIFFLFLKMLKQLLIYTIIHTWSSFSSKNNRILKFNNTQTHVCLTPHTYSYACE